MRENRSLHELGEMPMNKKNHKKKNRSKSGVKPIFIGVVIGLFVVAAVGLIVAYSWKEHYYSTHFLKETIVNDIDISGMTIEELNQQIRTYRLVITERAADGSTAEEVITGDEIDLNLSSTKELEKILEGQKKGKWLTNKVKSYKMKDFVDYNEAYWKQCMSYLNCFKEEFVQKPVDAYISEYDNSIHGYQIIPEIYGNQLEEQKTIDLLAEAVRTLNESVDLTKTDFYKKPMVLSTDERLNLLTNNLNHYVNVTITYTFGDNVEIVNGDLINEWIHIEDDLSISLDVTKVEEYVATLRKRYDTIFRKRTFMTTSGKEVEISEGDYGWWMNYKKETEELAAMIDAGESGERTPVYYQTAAQYGPQDYGNTYVEVNLTAQHLYFYENGELVLDSDFVSGNTSRGNGTPSGVYGITYKQRNATLVGEDYSTPVSYWMPFNKHVGLHDATWRYVFGDSIYKNSGSHGCVNLPYVVAKELYNYVSKGTPVICYELKGTESDSITNQTAEDIAQSVIERISEIGAVTKNSKDSIERARLVYEELNQKEKALVSNYDVLVAAEKTYQEINHKK